MQKILLQLKASYLDLLTALSDHAVSSSIEVNDLFDTYTIAWYAKQPNASHIGETESKKELSYSKLSAVLTELRAKSKTFNKFTDVINNFIQTEMKPIPIGILPDPTREARTLCFEFIKQKQNFEVDEDRANSIIESYYKTMIAPTFFIKSYILIQHFSAPKQIDLDDGVLRPISSEVIDRFGRSPDPSYIPQFGFYPDYQLHDDDWILEIDKDIRKDKVGFEMHRANEDMENLATALQLNNKGRAILRHIATFAVGQYPQVNFFGGLPVYSAPFGDRIEMSDDDMNKIRDDYSLIKKVKSDQAYVDLQLALRRLRLSATRREKEDAIIDNVIGIESLLCRDSNVEISYRFSRRGAFVLSSNHGNPTERINKMQKLYSLRSKIVHGNADANKIETSAAESQEILCEMLRWFIAHSDIATGVKNVLLSIDQEMVTRK